jgi:hypothetical protein
LNAQLVVSWITSIVIAIVLGTVWLNLPTTSAGAFTRGGLLFISLLFNAFQAFSELARYVKYPLLFGTSSIKRALEQNL